VLLHWVNLTPGPFTINNYRSVQLFHLPLNYQRTIDDFSCPLFFKLKCFVYICFANHFPLNCNHLLKTKLGTNISKNSFYRKMRERSLESMIMKEFLSCNHKGASMGDGKFPRIQEYIPFFITSGVFKGRRPRHLHRLPFLGPPRSVSRVNFLYFLVKNLLYTHIIYSQPDHK